MDKVTQQRGMPSIISPSCQRGSGFTR